MDLSASVACSSSDCLTSVGRIGVNGINTWRGGRNCGSAPVSPRSTPPASPQHWPRRNINNINNNNNIIINSSSRQTAQMQSTINHELSPSMT